MSAVQYPQAFQKAEADALKCYVCLFRPPRTPNKKGKVVRRLKSARPMFRGYTCFSPAALHRHWYKDHPFLRGPTPEVGSSS